MLNHTSSHKEDHPGFSLLPPRRTSEPGYAGLDIWLSQAPTGLHFDPQQVSLYIHGKQEIDFLCIEHPWAGDNHLQVVAGGIDLIDFKGHHIEGFCFGGSLEMTRLESETRLELRSPAPILLNLGAQSIRHAPTVSILVDEFTILIARRKAFWERQPGTFDQKLAAADPLKLYAAFLPAARHRLQALPPMGNSAQLEAQHILHQEMDALSELIPGFELGIADLL